MNFCNNFRVIFVMLKNVRQMSLFVLNVTTRTNGTTLFATHKNSFHMDMNVGISEVVFRFGEEHSSALKILV